SRLDTAKDGPGQLFRRGARHLTARDLRLGEDRAYQQGAVRTNCRSDGSPLRGQDSGDKRAVQAGRTVSLSTGTAPVSGHPADALSGELRMVQNHRSVN